MPFVTRDYSAPVVMSACSICGWMALTVVMSACSICGLKALTQHGLCADCIDIRRWSQLNRAFCALIHGRPS